MLYVTQLPPATIFQLSPDMFNIIPMVDLYIRLVLCCLIPTFLSHTLHFGVLPITPAASDMASVMGMRILDGVLLIGSSYQVLLCQCHPWC